VGGPYPKTRLRVWSFGAGIGELRPGGLGVEWCGRGGHPTSYALLGGHLAHEGDGPFEVRLSGLYADALASRTDPVHFGITEEYVEAASRGLGGGIAVTIAAHGYASSSPMAFEWLGRLLAVGLRQGLPAEDSELLNLWRLLTPESRAAR